MDPRVKPEGDASVGGRIGMRLKDWRHLLRHPRPSYSGLTRVSIAGPDSSPAEEESIGPPQRLFANGPAYIRISSSPARESALRLNWGDYYRVCLCTRRGNWACNRSIVQNDNRGGDSKNIVLSRRIVTQEALIKLAEVHRRFVEKKRDGRRVIMRNCVLVELDIRGLCFAQAHFMACLFSRANLTDADFSRAKLFGSTFESADLTRANFERADLRAVVFDKANLKDARFDEADLRRGGIIANGGSGEQEVFREIRSSFRNANLSHTNLRNAVLKDVDFTGALLEGTELYGADLRGSRFTGAELKSVVLTNARLQEADLRGAAFEDTRVELSGLLATPMEAVDPVTLVQTLADHERWVRSDGKHGKRADFSEQNLTEVDLSGRSLATISFANANLKSVNFDGSVLAACDFSNANLRKANFSGSDLRGANFIGAMLEETRFSDANIGALPETGMETVFPDGFLLDREVV